MKKTLIVIGSVSVLYIFVSYILPNFIGIPLAAYHSQKNWTENIKELNESNIDSIRRFPSPLGVVSDYENIFSEDEVLNLTKIITNYEKATTRQIAFITLKSIEPYNNIIDYSTDLANEWGIGKVKENNGILIILSSNLRKIRISTGYGTEKILTDEICKEIIDNTIIPEFKQGEYYTGIEKGILAIINKWR